MNTGLSSMLEEIEAEVRYTSRMIGKSKLDPRVMQAMGEVPRDRFVPPDMRGAAFDNGPLPIGSGQTISQPYIVALMTDLLALEPDHRVLEIGTGSGYQTAVLSKLCRRVYSVEVLGALREAAAERLEELGYRNVETRTGNGYEGWPEHAPYDAIIVTAAAPYIPEPLIEQLKPGGRMAIPLGRPYGRQELELVRKTDNGEIETRSVLAVAFVPLVDVRDAGDDNRIQP